MTRSTEIAPARVSRLLTAAEFHWLVDVPPEVELFANLTNRSTRRADENAVRDLTRDRAGRFVARFLCQVGFIAIRGAHDPDIARRFAATFARDGGQAVQSLRRDSHAKGRTCGLHGAGWCLSRRQPVATSSAAP